ncbi:MAG: hypothetical protein NTU80_04165 [Verrucomicrobia bacterium]|nr:hypothetical protein [Verrucomicrobiota bacterium]
MITPRRPLLLGFGCVALGIALLFGSACKPKATAQATPPLPFTGQLTELEGVQAVVSLRHPKLILGDLDKLMAAVPEAGMLRMVLPQLTPYGYPEFSEFAPDANIGVALLESTAPVSGKTPSRAVAFAKLKPDGKIATALVKSGLVLEVRGEWTWITKDAADFAQIKAPEALLAYINRPQTAELRAWGRATPAVLGELKTVLWSKLQTQLASRDPAEQKAASAYHDILWSYLAELHSGGASLDFNDQGIALEYRAQFLPDSALGKLARYPAGPTPRVAPFVSADALMNAVVRQNMTGQTEFVSGFLDKMTAVDFPPFAESLKRAGTSYLAYAAQTDGGAVVTLDMTMPEAGKTPVVEFFGVQTGEFTPVAVSALYRDGIALGKQFNHALFSALAVLAPDAPMPELKQVLKENALAIDGIAFGSVTTTSSLKGQTTTQLQYYGVVDGSLVYSMGEEALRKKLPALRAQKPLADAVPSSFQDGEVLVATISGAKIVDRVGSGLQLNLADPDVSGRIASLKKAYTDGGPVRMTVSARQAEAVMNVTIPYAFIAQSVQLGQFANANRKPGAP